MSESVTTEALDAVDRDIEHARGLPSGCYTSVEYAERERDAVLARTWTCIGHAEDVPVGHAVPTSLLGLPLVSVRDSAGELRVFHNVCRHRGFRLVAEPCAVRAALRCPYHSWTYGLDGGLRGTPHIGGPGVHETPGFERARYGLWPVRSAVWMGLVFVNLSGDAVPFETHVAPLERRWRAFVGADGFAALRVPPSGGRMALTVRANWKLAVENYCESYHLPWIHPGLNSYSRLEDHYHIMLDGTGAGQGTTAFNFNARAGISLPPFPRWPAASRGVAEYVALYPNTLLGLQLDHFYAIVLQPLSHDETLESVHVHYVGDEAVGAQFAAARERNLEGWREVFAEDVSAVEGMQAGRASSAFDGGRFSPVMDNPTHHFHRWMATRMAAA